MAQAGGSRPTEPGVPSPTVSANLALRLIQLHLVVIYGMAGLAKLQGPSWWNGMALWRTMTAGEFVVLDFTALAAWPLLINLLTHVSLAIELALSGVDLGSDRASPFAGRRGDAHLGIAVMSPGLTEFALAMLAGNLAFVSGAWLRGLVTGPTQPALRVLFDGACPRCRASMALITAADPDHVVEPIDLTALDVTIDPSRLEAQRIACGRCMWYRRTAGLPPGLTPCGRSRPRCRYFGRLRRSCTSRGSHGRAVAYTIGLRPLGRATFPARTKYAGSTLERRRSCLATEATLKTITTRSRLWRTPRRCLTHELAQVPGKSPHAKPSQAKNRSRPPAGCFFSSAAGESA